MVKAFPSFWLSLAILTIVFSVCADAQVKQTTEAIEAYQTCRRFQRLLAEDLNFARAFDAEFTKDIQRQKAIAIADGEFGDGEDLRRVSSKILIDAYKQRMQIFYLMLALSTAKNSVDSALLFPPAIEKIIKRETVFSGRSFTVFARQLNQDAVVFRKHFDKLIASNPAVAGSVRRFKADLLSTDFTMPTEKVLPQRDYYRSGVLKSGEEFYQIDGYYLIKEQGKMRIIGIRFFTRLF